jgi:hypothetical protein
MDIITPVTRLCFKRSPSCHRPTPERALARTELIELLESQLDTLARETFGVVTEAELFEYEDSGPHPSIYAEPIDGEAAT